ncbi:hypothetical protein Hdeb2414_s0017g00508601 [Helianthus debilis subsp. tardiflorus]
MVCPIYTVSVYKYCLIICLYLSLESSLARIGRLGKFCLFLTYQFYYSYGSVPLIF